MKFVVSLFLSLACHLLMLAMAFFFMPPEKRSAAPVIEPPALDISFVKESDSEEVDDSAEPVNSAASVSPPHRMLMPKTELGALHYSERGDLAVAAPRADTPKIPERPVVDPPPLDMPPKEREGEDETEDVKAGEASTGVMASPAPKQARVDEKARALSRIVPRYPEEARRRRITGVVRIRMTIDAEGCASSVRVTKSSGYKNLDKAALEAVSRAKFTPAKSGGKAVSSEAEIDVKFELNKARRANGL